MSRAKSVHLGRVALRSASHPRKPPELLSYLKSAGACMSQSALMNLTEIWYQMLIHSTNIPLHLENRIIPLTSVDRLTSLGYSFCFGEILEFLP
jgi:hypothetical protein